MVDNHQDLKTSVALSILFFLLSLTTTCSASETGYDLRSALHQEHFCSVLGVAEFRQSGLPPVLLSKSPSDKEGPGDLEEQLKLLLEELKALERDAKEKFQKEILPYLREEIRKLRERLREFQQRREQPSEPDRTRV